MESFPTELDHTPTVAEDPALGLSIRAKFEILGAVLLGMFLSALDQTIVGPVLPKIVSDLQGSDFYTWAVTIYLLTSTVTVPIYGKLSDLYGRKPILIIGISLFLVGSALSGLSQEMWQLVLFRGIQGLGAGALFPRRFCAANIRLFHVPDIFAFTGAGHLECRTRAPIAPDRAKWVARPGERQVWRPGNQHYIGGSPALQRVNNR